MINKIFNFQFSIFNSSRGFTVLESIVAILILSLSISGAFSAVQQGLSQSIIAKDEVRAFYLAQEAIEVIRNQRDTNQIVKIKDDTGSWLDGITQGISPYYCPFSTIAIKNTCMVDASAAVGNKIQTCGTDDWGNCPYLNQDSASFLYNHNPVSATNPATNFKREVQIESINANEIAVVVRISWTKGIINKEFKIKTLLFNWIY